MKRLSCIVITLLLVSLVLTNAGPNRRATYRIKTVCIDAGHGGHDSGCLGSSSKEKEVALSIALKLGKLIEQNFSDVKVIYTRKTDVFIPLHERANIANRAKADLFICIHLNSGAKSAYGSETYVMGLHKTNDNLGVAKRENAAILLEDDYKTQYDGFDPNSPEANIIFSLYQNQYMHQSVEFASKIQQQFEEHAGRFNRGVKQAGFLVLYKTAMPAVLIENGFLSHDAEEKFLDSDKGQTTMATAIYRAFKEYKIDNDPGTPAPSEIIQETGSQNPQNDKPEQSPAKEIGTSSSKEEVKAIATTEHPPIDTPKTELPKPVVKSIPKDDAKIIEVYSPFDAKPTPTPQKNPSVKPSSNPEKTAPAKPIAATKEQTIFIAVQIGASAKPNEDNSKFGDVEGARGINCKDGFTRYVVGSYTTIDEARKKQTQLKSQGFIDCFLTAFNGEVKITIQEAELLLKRK